MNNGVFMTPGVEEEWTISIAHTEADLQRFVDALEAFAKDVTAS
jgi:glutamate-1-semialdehyde 2,1-aminomutase